MHGLEHGAGIGGFMWIFWILLIVVVVFLVKGLVSSESGFQTGPKRTPSKS